MVGLLGGYLDSNLKFNASSNSIDYTGGTVGAYATYINRGFYLDTIFKADLLKMKWNANTLAAFGVAAPETDANSYGIQADTGYRFQNGATFWEPLGTHRLVAHQHRHRSRCSARASASTIPTAFAAAWAAEWVWRTTGAGMKVEASITGRVWHEFEDPAALVINQGLLTIERPVQRHLW